MGKRIGVYKYIHALPRDAYGNRYRIGGKILSQKFGLGTVIGVARGGDGRICVVCNFRAAYGEAGKFTSKWRTWLVPAEEGVAVEVKEETDVEADKPIFNQQGGRGKLYGPTHGATYMGTYQMPDGKMDRRMFNCATNKDAIKAYTDWCADMDARILEEMEEKVRPKAKAQQPKEKPAYTEPFKKDEVKGADMATTADAKLDKIYVVMVVGGVAVAWCESFDKAVAVCDALTLGAKASGFAATYDVVEVKKWTA